MYVNIVPFPADQRAIRKMATSELKVFCVPSLRRQNLLLLCHECSDGHLSGHVRIWSLENPHEVLELKQDSSKLNVFCAISRQKVYKPFDFEEPTVPVSSYLDSLQLLLLPQL
ncbi:hypothetical protein TNCV_3335481 [Trichonephila clavipes]|nr:hypothetical protein TNCV_3335481 [Trichonephila clavipes]